MTAIIIVDPPLNSELHIFNYIQIRYEKQQGIEIGICQINKVNSGCLTIDASLGYANK